MYFYCIKIIINFFFILIPCHISNRYGPGCEYSCYCNDNGVCHHVTGTCICNTGYTGPHCMESQ